MDSFKDFEKEIDKKVAEKALSLIKKIKKESIEKTSIAKAGKKEGYICVAFHGKDHIINFILNEQKKLDEVQLLSEFKWYIFELKHVDKKKKEELENLLKEYVSHFNLRLRILTTS